MTVFVDTSALLALVDADDEHHSRAVAAWARFERDEITLLSTNYVLVEAVAVVQHRLGMGAVQALAEIIRSIDLVFVEEPTHHTAFTTLLSSGRRKLSLVDCASFEVMRRSGLDTAFTYGRHFKEQGFAVVS